jgi:YbbR domain-containing protein
MLALPKKINSYVPQFIGRNFGRKVCAIIFATLVYIKISSELVEDKVIYNVPITLVKHGNIEALAYKPETVAVAVSGSRNRVRLMSTADIRIEIPIDESVLNERYFSPYKSINFGIDFKNVKLPIGVKVTNITPGGIAVHIDRLRSKNVQIEPSFRGNLPNDYSVGDIKIVPRDVTVTGPDSIIEQIDSVLTKPIILDKSTVDSFSVERAFQNTDKNILISPKTVQVSVEVYKTVGTRIFQDIPVSIMADNNNERSYKETLLPGTVNITLGGPNSALDSLRANQIRAFVDVSKLGGPGVYDIKVGWWITDPNINLKFIDPSVIKVKIEKN